MAVTTTSALAGPFLTNGVTTAFPFTFKAFTGEEVAALFRDEDMDRPVSPSLYSVAVTGSGGTLIFATPPVAGRQLYIYSSPTFLQDITFEDGSRFLASPVNGANDRAAVRDLALRRDVNRKISLPIGEGGPDLPQATKRANKYLYFDAAGNPTVNAAPPLSAIREGALNLSDYGFLTVDDPRAAGLSRLALAIRNTDAFALAAADAKLLGVPGMAFPRGVAPYTDRGAFTGQCLLLDGFPDLTLFVDDCTLERYVRDLDEVGVHPCFGLSNGSYTVVGGTFRHYDPISIPVTIRAIYSDRFVISTDWRGYQLPSPIDNILLISTDKKRVLAGNVIHDDDYDAAPDDPANSPVTPNGDGTWSLYCDTANVFRPDKYLAGSAQVGMKMSLTPQKRGGQLFTVWNSHFEIHDSIIQECGNTCIQLRAVANPVVDGVKLRPRRGYLSTAAGFINLRNCTGVFVCRNTELNWINADGFNSHTLAYAVGTYGGSQIQITCSDATTATIASSVPRVPEDGSTLVFLSPSGTGDLLTTVQSTTQVSTAGGVGVYNVQLDRSLPAGYNPATWQVYNQEQAASLRIDATIRVGVARGVLINSCDSVINLKTDRLLAGSVHAGYPFNTAKPQLCGWRGGLDLTLDSRDCTTFLRNPYYSSDISFQWTQYGFDDTGFNGMPRTTTDIMLPITVRGQSLRSGLGGVRAVGIGDIKWDFVVSKAGALRGLITGMSSSKPPFFDIFLNGLPNISGDGLKTDNPNPAAVSITNITTPQLVDVLAGIRYPSRRKDFGTVTSAVTIDMNAWETASLTLGANIVLNATGSPGRTTLVEIKQDATGGRTITPGDGFIDPSWSASPDPGAIDFLNLYSGVDGVYSAYDAELPA